MEKINKRQKAIFDFIKERIKNVLGNTRDLTMLKPDLTSWEE